jgi:hypothetical protein
LIAAPLYAGLSAEAKLRHQPLHLPGESFEDLRLHFKKEVATLLAAFTAAAFFVCAFRFGNLFQAPFARRKWPKPFGR